MSQLLESNHAADDVVVVVGGGATWAAASQLHHRHHPLLWVAGVAQVRAECHCHEKKDEPPIAS